jgi:hypothetical protein
MLTFYIPLGEGSKWDDNELRYLLRSLEANVQQEYSVDICSVSLPSWIRNVNHIYVERKYPEWLEEKNNGKRHYENYFDTLNKLKLYSSKFGHMDDDIIYVTDDVLLIGPLHSVEQVKNYPLEKETVKTIDERKRKVKIGKKHHNTILKCYDLLSSQKTWYNFDSHFPRRFNRGLLKDMFAQFDYNKMDIPYSFATMYGNMYYDGLPTLHEENNYGAGFYGYNIGKTASYPCSSKSQILDAIDGKLWISYNDFGLNWRGSGDRQHLKEYIMEKFPEPSWHEK